jgi:uncharacterized membrane protein
MPRYLAILSSIIIIAYPFAVYAGVTLFGIGGAAVFIALLFLLRFFLPTVSGSLSQQGHTVRLMAAAGFVMAALSLVMNDAKWFRCYPVAVSLLLLGLFGYGLFRPPSMIERIARLKDPDLPDAAVRYTRKLTFVWCLFFLFNGLIALYTALAATLEVWTLYNGFISYILIGALLLGEYCFRIFHLKGSRT